MLQEAVEYSHSFTKKTIKKIPVWKTVLFSILTFGLYIPVWLIKRGEEFNAAEGKRLFKKRYPVLILILYSLSLAVFWIGPFFINEVALMLYEYIDILITYFAFILIVFYCFEIRKFLMAKEVRDPISKLLTFILSIWYIQYHINKMDGEGGRG